MPSFPSVSRSLSLSTPVKTHPPDWDHSPPIYTPGRFKHYWESKTRVKYTKNPNRILHLPKFPTALSRRYHPGDTQRKVRPSMVNGRAGTRNRDTDMDAFAGSGNSDSHPRKLAVSHADNHLFHLNIVSGRFPSILLCFGW